MYYIKKIFSFQYPQDYKTKIKIALFYFVSLIICFALFRFLICIVYSDVFSALTLADKAASFLYGLRFDLAMASMLLGGFIILMFLPYPKHSIFIKICVTLMAITFLLSLLLLGADFFYFREVNRHMTEDIILAWRDKEFITQYIIRYYWYLLIIFLAFVIAVLKISFKVIDKNYAPKPLNIFKGIGIFIAVILLVVLLRRGNFSGMPVNLSDAYKIPKSSENIQLILNGLFVQYYYLKSTGDTKGVIVNKFPYDRAVENIQKILLSENEFIPDSKYPIMRQIISPDKKPAYNVVIFLLESWTPRYIDSFNEKTSSKYGVTENFDKIANEGIKFNNAFAAGNRSQYGLFSSLIGLPLVPGTVRYYGLDTMTKFTSIAEAFNKKGYFTMYAQSTERNAIGMVNAAKNFLHFQESYGKEDFPVLMEYISNAGNSGYDYDMFDFSAKKASRAHKSGQPFFLYLFTGSTHMPFKELNQKFEKYPRKNNNINAYLNSLYYADYSIGHFMDIAKKEGFFDNTIFIFMADHMIALPDVGNTIRDRFRIPFVIYAPKILKAENINWTVSQADLIPTIWHLFGIELPFTAIGVNALSKDANHFAFIVDGSNIVLYEREKFISDSRVRVVETNLDESSAEFNIMYENLLSIDKSITETFRFDKWYK